MLLLVSSLLKSDEPCVALTTPWPDSIMFPGPFAAFEAHSTM